MLKWIKQWLNPEKKVGLDRIKATYNRTTGFIWFDLHDSETKHKEECAVGCHLAASPDRLAQEITKEKQRFLNKCNDLRKCGLI